MTAASSSARDIWWANGIFFVAVHVAACLGIFFRPLWRVPRPSVLLAVAVWQLACFGVTIGYHRLYSHRAFRAALGVRIVLAAFGSMAFQGSIKWWCLRHRLHHRFTDDPVHDPYAATRGLFFSHVGWIFYKPKYEKLDQINRDDLENDPVVRFQHAHYVPLALFLGFVMPTFLGWLWNDPSGAFVWGGLVSRLAIWHCTFLVNSLAHWEGLQPYSDENTSRGNLVMAFLTCGEGNHNYHAFPQDFRAGPESLDWDPSKWIILLLHRCGLATGLRRALDEDIRDARAWMARRGLRHSHRHFRSAENLDSAPVSVSLSSSSEPEEEHVGVEGDGEDGGEWVGERWGVHELREYVRSRPGLCVLLLDGYVVDVTGYLGEHPGGASLLRTYSVRVSSGSHVGAGEDVGASEKSVTERQVDGLQDATAAFGGGLNKHSRAARRRVRQLRVALFVADSRSGGAEDGRL